MVENRKRRKFMKIKIHKSYIVEIFAAVIAFNIMFYLLGNMKHNETVGYWGTHAMIYIVSLITVFLTRVSVAFLDYIDDEYFSVENNWISAIWTVLFVTSITFIVTFLAYNCFGGFYYFFIR
jgi:hypothetical protein